MEESTTQPPAEITPPETLVVGLRFRRAGRIYYFHPGELELTVRDEVVVETERGLELGTVIIAPHQVIASQLSEPLKEVLRKAEPRDTQRWQELRAKEGEVLNRCLEKVRQFNLPMKLLGAEYNLDGSRLTIYFTAEGRVDFRELVRELASTFKTRVELRQLGPRDQTKLVGGVGHCGLLLCCATHLTCFNNVSIRMAREQGLPLNPAKISGVCGRLLCCLGYEVEQYRVARSQLPKEGLTVTTPKGIGKVIAAAPLTEMVTVKLEDATIVQFPQKDVSPVGETTGRGRGRSGTSTDM
ncbi:MAG: stage 0 sporulation family protein [Chloroflexi bacterium]|nr:stage 0 sporulation family protein [Chloroflexota bacterium]